MVNGDKIILTNSAINAFKSCPKKYYYRYIRELEAIEKPEALLLGSAIHSFLEAHYRQLPYDPPPDLASKSQAILKGVREYYPILYMDDFDLFEPVAVERVISGEILNPASNRPARDYAYGGKVDGLIMLKKDAEGFKKGSLLLMEHKSTSKLDEVYFERLQLDSQLLLYSLYLSRELGAPIVGTLFNVILKPSLRQKKSESEAEYHQRLRLEMDWPEQYHRRFLRFPDQRLQEIQKELWDSKNIIGKARQVGIYTMNSASCWDWHRRCDYFSLCASEDPEQIIQESGQFQHQEAHVELIGAAEGIIAETAATLF